MGDDIIIDLPAVKLVEWISAAVARICFVWENHTNSVQASRIPNMCGFYVESIRMLVRNWIRQHFLGWDVIGWTLQFDLAERMMGDFSGFWWQRCHWFHVSSTSPLDRMCHGPKTPAPIHNSNDNTNVKKVAEKNMNKKKNKSENRENASQVKQTHTYNQQAQINLSILFNVIKYANFIRFVWNIRNVLFAEWRKIHR